MADTYSQTRTLGVLVTGGKVTDPSILTTITIKVPNPRDDLQPSDFTNDIKTFFNTVAEFSGKLDGNQTYQGIEFSGAYTETQTKVSLDLTPTS